MKNSYMLLISVCLLSQMHGSAEKTVQPNQTAYREFWNAIDHNDLTTVQRLAETHQSLVWPHFNESALHAAQLGHGDIYMYLLSLFQRHVDNGAAITKEMRDRVVSGDGNHIFLDAACDAASSQTALCYVARHGRKDFVKKLIEAGASINILWGLTALGAAISENHFDIVKLLCEHGAGLFFMSQESPWTFSPSMNRKANACIVKYLVRHGYALHNIAEFEKEYVGSNVAREQEVIGKALEGFAHVTGFPSELNRLILAFLNPDLRLPDMKKWEESEYDESVEWAHLPQSSVNNPGSEGRMCG